jgi:hopanoid biosynthesis associated protein HpnK
MARSPAHLIVNADDLGISRGVNRAIVQAHRSGIVTSASIMANLPSAEDALTRTAICPDLGLGLHLTLTAGRPLSSPAQVPTLVDTTGDFLLLGTLLGRLARGQVRADDLRRELGAQVEWALRRGVIPTHLDSHHHVHIFPTVTRVVVELAREHTIRWVRTPLESGPLPRTLSLPPRDAARTVAISLFGMLARVLVHRAGLRTTHHFRGIALGSGWDTAALLRLLNDLPAGLTELMTHPGIPDEELARLTTLVDGRDRELAALTDPAARETVRQRRVRLTNFGFHADPPRRLG